MRATKVNGSGNVYEWRACAWAEIRRLKKFHVDDLKKKCHAHHRAIVDYVIGLVRAGYLRTAGAEGVFELARDAGVEAPMLRRDGQELRDTREREALWRTMKMLREFTAVDLSVHASTEEHPISQGSAAYYLDALRLAGYLAPAGRTGRRLRYRLVPSRAKSKPPLIQHVMQVFDPNEGKVVWQAGQGGVA
jgi:hypothetical protein